jgi:20S proteasome alpha/beta subunit
MKIQKIDDHAGMTMAGGVADAQNITDILKLGERSSLFSIEELL